MNRKHIKQSLLFPTEGLATSLTERVSPRLKELERGGYAREYVRGKRRFKTGLQMAVAEIIGIVASDAKQNVVVPGTKITADFKVNGAFVFVDRALDDAQVKQLGRLKRKCMLISSSQMRSDVFDPGIRVIQIGKDEPNDLQTIFLDDPSFNFDYAHILPHTSKCSVMHGHTSSALVEIVGRPLDGMVVDFGAAKDAIREAIRSLDHKLFINEKYIVREDSKSVTLRFMTVHGEFAIEAPKGTTVLLKEEATVENLAKEVLLRITPQMPKNVTAVGVYVYEGLNKGSHLIAQIHQTRGENKRPSR
jgi:6-pyruvoyltetrahydropterin/6-carboxytetrahydropterin synthase